MSNKKSMVLIILDGWGYRENTDANAISNANTPVLDNLKAHYPNMLIETSGMAVGLPDGQMGNSEVGHVNLGAGRIVYQDFTRITKSISDGEFEHNPALCAAVDKAVAASGGDRFSRQRQLMPYEDLLPERYRGPNQRLEENAQ